jgi:MFS transporter, ACS family, tartrate transporter
VPSNLLLHRVGARIWIGRILVTWGIVAMATGAVQNVQQFYVARFLLGVAEAGFFPGIILYLTYWFRQRDQARVISLFVPRCRWPVSWAPRFQASYSITRIGQA